MNGITVLVSLAVIGVDYGWQPLPDGQLEYIVQIEPSLLDELENGEEIVSEILPEARGVRRFRIRVGTGDVPRIARSQGNTTPRRQSPGGSDRPSRGAGAGRGSAVLPPRVNEGASSTVTGEVGPSGDDFRPDGFLNLPPPPPLLGPDGKSSVLVPPGGPSGGSVPAGGDTQEVLPPAVSGGAADASPPSPGTANPAPPAGSNAGTSNTTAPSESGSTSRPRPEQPSTGIYPPPFKSQPAFPNRSNGTVLPPGEENDSNRNDSSELLPPDSQPVRPVPAPSSDSGSPNPIPFGKSGVKPPTADATVTHGPTPPTSPSAGQEGVSAITSDSESAPEQLQANAAASEPSELSGDPDAAALKPAMDEKTAEELAPKPWTPLVLTSLALFASLAANAYLGWVGLGIYQRYRDVVSQLHQAQASAA